MAILQAPISADFRISGDTTAPPAWRDLCKRLIDSDADAEFEQAPPAPPAQAVAAA